MSGIKATKSTKKQKKNERESEYRSRVCVWESCGGAGGAGLDVFSLRPHDASVDHTHTQHGGDLWNLRDEITDSPEEAKV